MQSQIKTSFCAVCRLAFRQDMRDIFCPKCFEPTRGIDFGTKRKNDGGGCKVYDIARYRFRRG